MILKVLEHQKIHIRKKRDLNKLQISYSDAEIIKAVDQKNGFIFKWGNDYVIPQQWVGLISCKDFSIEILPKISDINELEKSCEILYKMLEVVYDVPIKNGINAKVKLIQNGLIEIFITNYIEYIKKYIQSGPILDYKKNIKNLKAVKGNLIFSAQINHNAINLTKFMCKYSKMDMDNKYNQIIKLTLIKMKNLSRNNINKKMIQELLQVFDSVKLNINLDYKNICVDKTHYRLKDIIKLSQLFLDNYSASLTYGNYNIVSLLFDMNKLFEKYIYTQLKKIYKQNIWYQYSKEFLLKDVKTGIKKVNLKPDMYLKLENFNIVIDTKWKRMDNTTIKESDAYQMNAYLSVLNNTKKCIVIYPKSYNNVELDNSFVIQDMKRDKIINTKTVDLQLLLDKNNDRFIERLRNFVVGEQA